MKIDSGLVIAHLDREADHRERVVVYLNRESGELISVFSDDEAIETGDPFTNIESKRAVQSDPVRYLPIPLPDHSLLRRWFDEFLASIGYTDECVASIGGWLESQGREERRAWHTFRAQRVCEHLRSVAANAGIRLEIS
jgi:hypothetical protein